MKRARELYLRFLNAQVAKLVDALCSGRSVRKDVLVRIQSWAQCSSLLEGHFYFLRTLYRAKIGCHSAISQIPVSKCHSLKRN